MNHGFHRVLYFITMEAVGMILIVSSRFLELVGIIMIIFFAIKKYKARYIYYTTFIIFVSISISAAAIFLKEYFIPLSIASTVISSLLLLGLIIYVIKHREETLDIQPQEGERCPVCTAFVRDTTEGLSTLTVDDVTLFFDSPLHLLKFMEDPLFYIKQRRLPVTKLEFENIFIKSKDTKKFREPSHLRFVYRGEDIEAFENPPKGEETYTFEDILKRMKVNQDAG